MLYIGMWKPKTNPMVFEALQKEVFGPLSVIRLLVKWAEVEMID